MIYDQRHDRVPGSFLSEYHARLYASSVIKTNREKDDLYIDRVRKEAKRFPKSAWLRIMCGQILLKNNEYVVDAELEFSAAVDMDEKGETTARFWLAESYIKQELFDEAIAIAIEDTKARPKKCDAWGNLGEANAYAGNYEEAYAAFRRALEANPNYTYAQNQLTRIEKILERR
jgi:predicted Zn-dependent protease